MRVDFIARIPGNHKHIKSFELYAVPRQGEAVIISDIPREVHSVEWITDADDVMFARVLLK